MCEMGRKVAGRVGFPLRLAFWAHHRSLFPLVRTISNSRGEQSTSDGLYETILFEEVIQ